MSHIQNLFLGNTNKSITMLMKNTKRSKMPGLKNKKSKNLHPVAKMILPKQVQKVGNGNLTPKMLTNVKCGGKMWTNAAEAFNAMYDAALAAGHKLKNIGDYRPLDGQLALFNDRYSLEDQGRNPKITRNYNGKTWYLKPGKAPAGTPGTSNHRIWLGHRHWSRN